MQGSIDEDEATIRTKGRNTPSFLVQSFAHSTPLSSGFCRSASAGYRLRSALLRSLFVHPIVAQTSVPVAPGCSVALLKCFAVVCSDVVKHDPRWLKQEPAGGVYIVTGAQLIIKANWPKTVLHLRLLFTHLPNCTVRKTEWASAPTVGRKSSLFSNLSSTFSFTQRSVANAQKQLGLPPVPARFTKLCKFVDTDEVVRGPHDSPGHWLVTAGKLVMDGGKIGLHVKFALLDFAQE
ncbi:hypothetical protein E3N88_16523 [Mikania micrantha]|uniref:MACPF domain-containing protein n=1 Tax=Mikania micrantha TaxID=192012 RepID=A0A5N6P0Q4_9ASTR|nr:hypothetical protein E3N88_16523 [Mikania micrantha]